MKVRLFLLLPVLLLAGCTEQPGTLRHSFFALGTLVEVSVFDPPRDVDVALRQVESALLAEEHRWRAWGDGELAAINRALAAGGSVEIPAGMMRAIDRARELSASSGHRFNPAMGRLVAAWQFHQEERGDLPPPDKDMLTPLVPPPTFAALARNEEGWQAEDHRLWLDFGAFAKGLALETATGVLREHGITNAIVNAGGDLKVIGRHGERPWKIGVRDPRGDGVLAAISVEDNESVFTSGDYERFFEWQGERFHHILDPRTGKPAQGVISVTVIHADAAVADAAATALFVAGAEDWREVAHSMGIEAVMIVLEDGSIESSRSMQGRIEFSP